MLGARPKVEKELGVGGLRVKKLAKGIQSRAEARALNGREPDDFPSAVCAATVGCVCLCFCVFFAEC